MSATGERPMVMAGEKCPGCGLVHATSSYACPPPLVVSTAAPPWTDGSGPELARLRAERDELREALRTAVSAFSERTNPGYAARRGSIPVDLHARLSALAWPKAPPC